MSYLYRTASFGSSNDSSCVLSFWIKKTKNDTLQGLFLGWNNSSNYATCYVNNDDTIYYKEKQGGTQYETRITSVARKFRDTNAWYHFVFQWDYTQASASNRIKVWINGELQTWENTGNLPPQNNTLRLKSSDFRIGDYTHAGSNYYNWQGLMSHVHFIDDATYDTYQASTFGETDSTTGEWKIKPDPGIATNNYGSQGFFVLKNGNSGTDQSGKGNNLSTNGTITKTEDCPSNVFATINPLDYSPNPATLSNGNTRYNKTSTGSGHNASMSGTLGAMTGKWYYEAKIKDTNYFIMGIIRTDHGLPNSEGYYGNDAGVYAIDNGGKVVAGSGSSVSGYSYSANDIFGMAFDLDNGKFYVHVNGTYLTSGDPTSGSTGTGSLGDISVGSRIYVPFITNSNYSQTNDIEFNFVNGYFGTTQVSSAGTNASNNGIFEYDVPAGYTALSTKGLNL